MARTNEPAPDDSALEGKLMVGSVDLSDIARHTGPFASLFLNAGEDAIARAQLAIDRLPVPPPFSGALIDTLQPASTRSQVVIVGGVGETWTFRLEDPFVIDLACFGAAPSLGPVIEASQVTASHVVITLDDDVYGLADFSPIEADSSDLDASVFESIDTVLDHLRLLRPRLVALIGATTAIERDLPYLQDHFSSAVYNSYPTDDIDGDLPAIADAVVRDAASLAAERRTHELAHFRQAREAGQTVEGRAVLDAIMSGSARRLLVHDDLVGSVGADGSRLEDRAIVAALLADTPITMVPDVPHERGPADGVGVILDGHGAPIPATAEDPQQLTGARASG